MVEHVQWFHQLGASHQRMCAGRLVRRQLVELAGPLAAQTGVRAANESENTQQHRPPKIRSGPPEVRSDGTPTLGQDRAGVRPLAFRRYRHHHHHHHHRCIHSIQCTSMTVCRCRTHLSPSVQMSPAAHPDTANKCNQSNGPTNGRTDHGHRHDKLNSSRQIGQNT